MLPHTREAQGEAHSLARALLKHVRRDLGARQGTERHARGSRLVERYVQHPLLKRTLEPLVEVLVRYKHGKGIARGRLARFYHDWEERVVDTGDNETLVVGSRHMGHVALLVFHFARHAR